MAPTSNWLLSWDTPYNLTTKEFGQHVVRLDRDLRRWPVTFAFVETPDGNFAFNFFISRSTSRTSRFRYDQRTFRQ